MIHKSLKMIFANRISDKTRFKLADIKADI
jgi:hypothetical protein